MAPFGTGALAAGARGDSVVSEGRVLSGRPRQPMIARAIDTATPQRARRTLLCHTMPRAYHVGRTHSCERASRPGIHRALAVGILAGSGAGPSRMCPP